MTAYYPDQNQPPDFLLFSPSAVSNEPGVILWVSTSADGLL